MDHNRLVQLRVPLHISMLPVVTGTVESSAEAFGLDRRQQLGLTLASEEVFSYLSRRAEAGQNMDVECVDGGFYSRIDFRFPGGALPVGALNMTASISPGDEDLEEMGLLIAARSVDRLDLGVDRDGTMVLSFVRERTYPHYSGDSKIPALLPPFTAGGPLAEEVQILAARALAIYGDEGTPSFFQTPGKVADMVASGEYSAVVARDGRGHVAGGMLWQWSGSMVRAYGTYVFDGDAELPSIIVESALSEMARRGPLCVSLVSPTPQTPSGYFEELGGCEVPSSRGEFEVRRALYRQLREDNGAVSWIHPEVEDFVRSFYDRMVLPRDIQRLEDSGRKPSAVSAFAVSLDRGHFSATLSPLWPGEDAAANLAGHLRSLREEHFDSVFFELDLGRAEFVCLVPALLAVGFVPRFILPWGGRGDILLFQHDGGF